MHLQDHICSPEKLVISASREVAATSYLSERCAKAQGLISQNSASVDNLRYKQGRSDLNARVLLLEAETIRGVDALPPGGGGGGAGQTSHTSSARVVGVAHRLLRRSWIAFVLLL